MLVERYKVSWLQQGYYGSVEKNYVQIQLQMKRILLTA